MNYKEKIQEAKANGYSNADIVNYLSKTDNKVKTALDNGYTPDEIVNFLEKNSNEPSTNQLNSSSKPNSTSQSLFIKSQPNTAQNNEQLNVVDTNIMDNLNNTTYNTTSMSPSLDTDTTTTPENVQDKIQSNVKDSEIDLNKFADDTIYSAKQEAMGAMSTFAGIYKAGLDVLSAIPGLKDTSLIKDAQEGVNQSIQFWNEASKELAKKKGYSQEGLFAPNNIGRMIPLFLAPTTTPIRAAVAINGALSYAEARGEGKTVTNSLIDASINSGLTYGSMKIFDYLTTSNAEKVYSELKEKLNISDEAANKIYKEYSTVMESQGDNSKVKALLWYAGKNKLNIGTKYITKISRDNFKAEKSIESEIMNRKNLLKDLTRNKYTDLTSFANDMKSVELQIKDDYSKLQSKLDNVSTSNVISKFSDDIPTSGPEWENMSDNLRSDLYKLKELSLKDNVTVKDLTDAYKSINSLLNSSSSKGTSKGVILSKMKSLLDKEIYKNLSKEDYANFKNINKDYSTFLTYKKSKMGQLIDSIIGNNPKTPTYSVDTILQKLPTLTESVDTFRAIRDLVGTEKSVKFENYLIDEIINKVDDYNWAKLNSMVGKKGFISDNANMIKDLSDKFEKYFNVDNLYTKTLADLELKEGAKTTVSDMLKALGVKKVAQMIAKTLPGEFGKETRFVSRLTKILSKPSNVQKIEESIESMSIEGRQKILFDTMKLLEYRPNLVTKTVDNIVNYVTPEGSVIPQSTSGTALKVSKQVISEQQNNLIKDFVHNHFKNSTDDVLSKAISHFNNHNIDNILKTAKEKLGKDYQTKWSKVYNTIVKNPVNDIVNNIENDTGLKLPTSSVEELYKREWKKDILLNSPRYDYLIKRLNKIVDKNKITALNKLTDTINTEVIALSKKLNISEEDAFKLLSKKISKGCK